MSAAESKERILIIDDECVIADTLVAIFSRSGYETRAVYSAESALSLLEREQWFSHLALIDVVLPDMNGIELAIILKAKYPGVRPALFSGQAATGDLLESARLGGHLFDVLAKPVHPSELLARVSSLLKHAECRECPPGCISDLYSLPT
jgi:DNA-binding response OmpR family regulator